MNQRFRRIQKTLKEKDLGGFIITNPVNIFYLCGFRGISPQEREAILIVTPNSAVLICPKLYRTEALKLKSPKLKIKIADERNRMFDIVKQLLLRTKNVGFEEATLTYSEFKHLKKELSSRADIAQKRCCRKDNKFQHVKH